MIPKADVIEGWRRGRTRPRDPVRNSKTAIIAAKIGVSMDKFTRLFVHRLHHLARREARRNALRNGLLEGKIVDVGGHLLFRYAPVFDTSRLSGEAIKRSGRLETHIEIAKPDVPTLAGILAHHLGDDVTALIREPARDTCSEADGGFSLEKIIADNLREEAEDEGKGAGR